MRSLAIVLLLHAMLYGTAHADEPPSAPPPVAAPAKLVVGTHPVPPFVIKNADGSWSGISIDLWRQLAERLGLAYEIREYEVKDLMAAGKSGAVDVLVSLNITAEREAEMDLTHAFYSTGLAIAVVPKPRGGVLATIRQIFTGKFLGLVGVLFGVLLVIGVLMWVAERRKNPTQFGGAPMSGIGAGLWWSAVTMTTVGYGDKSPVTVLGRVLALLWMFTGLVVISTFTAGISSALTVSQLEATVRGPDDLPRVRVGTVEPSQGMRYLQKRGITYHGYRDASAAVAGLAAGEVEAVVYEAPILKYLAHTEQQDRVTVLPGTFENHGYGFGLKAGSPLREELNRRLLEFTAGDGWTTLLAQYLGSS